MSDPSPHARLVERFAALERLAHARVYLEWDRSVTMPPGGNAARGDALAELASLHHERLTDPALAELLDAAEARTEADPVVRADLAEMRREHLEAAALPADLVRAKVLAGSRCEAGWRVQRPANDWAGFLESFRPVVALAREEADARLAAAAGAGSPVPSSRYETLLDLYCPGDGAALVEAVLDALRAALPALLERALDAQASAPVPALEGPFAVADQEALGRALAARLGFDFAAGRLDTSSHPFSTGRAGDLRITTRYVEADPFDALQATAHEIGHASYEGGLPAALSGRPVGRSRGMSVHESQSLFFEKHLYLSTAFQGAFAGEVHAHLAGARALDAEALRAAQLRVERGRIRTAADELTYPLHVMLRHRIERDLVDGRMEAEHVPEAWDGAMLELLGIDTRGDFRDGCLQDIHWTDGAFGYFPSYTLGAANAAQLAEALGRDEPGWREAVGRGDASEVREWLASRVWRRGATVDTATLMRDATGSATDASALLRHLERRYVERAPD